MRVGVELHQSCEERREALLLQCGLKLGTKSRVPCGQWVEALDERIDVEATSADHYCDAMLRQDPLQHRLGLPREGPRAPGLLDRQVTKEMMRYAQQLFFERAGRADAHGGVELTGIRADDLRAEVPGQGGRRLRLAGSRGAADDDQRDLHRNSSPRSSMLP